MRRGEIWRYEPVMQRSGKSTTRLIVSADAVNTDETVPVAYCMTVVSADPESLLAVNVEPHGWALAMEIERPPRRRLVERLGTATTEQMEAVDTALRAAFDL